MPTMLEYTVFEDLLDPSTKIIVRRESFGGQIVPDRSRTFQENVIVVLIRSKGSK